MAKPAEDRVAGEFDPAGRLTQNLITIHYVPFALPPKVSDSFSCAYLSCNKSVTEWRLRLLRVSRFPFESSEMDEYQKLQIVKN